jgi:hypothetical protein
LLLHYRSLRMVEHLSVFHQSHYLFLAPARSENLFNTN